MSVRSANWAAPYRPTVNVSELPADATPGQWVKLPNGKRGRFVGRTATGSAIVVPAVGKGRKARVSMAALRLARKDRETVLPKFAVESAVQDNPVETILNLLNF